MNSVPCNGCTICCQGDAVGFLPGDDPSAYQTEPHAYRPRERMLAHKPNGDCIYLTNQGCGIYERRPLLCRELDCRDLARKITYTTARQLDRKGMFKMAMWKKGRELSK